jgi:amino acid adenylation domain-containing protein
VQKAATQESSADQVAAVSLAKTRLLVEETRKSKSVPGFQGGQKEWKLEREARGERVVLSHAQQRLWFIDRLEGTSTEYNIAEGLRLRGELNREALERAINTIVERHESLRTHFAEVEGEPVQVIEAERRILLPLEDWSGLEEGARQEKVKSALREENEKPFDLGHGPVLRMRLLKLGEQEHVLLRTMHHIVCDRWSQGIFNREFMVLYEAYRDGRENPLKSLAVQYADFAMWQRRWLEERGLESGLGYWKEQLAEIPDEIGLTLDRPRPTMQTFAGEACRFVLSAEQVAGLKRLNRENQATSYMTLLAVFGVLLWRYSGQADVVVGSPIANRQESRLEALIGFFANTLVMRMQVRAGKKVRELLGEVRRTVLEAYRHQGVPFERLVEDLSPQRSLNRTPVFQVLFALQNTPMGAQRLKGVEVEPIRSEELRVRFDLEVHAIERGEEITLYWLYNKHLFDRWRMEQMGRHYVQLLDAFVKDPDCPVEAVDVLSMAERDRLLNEWNDTEAEYASERCVHELFEEQVERTPDAVAVVYEDQIVSYAELNRRAQQLAHYLRGLGVKADKRVAICMERSVDMMVALLGVLKAGGAYVPLDPDYPGERLRFLLQDSEPVVVLTQSHLGKVLLESGSAVPVVEVKGGAAWEGLAETNTERESIGLGSQHLGYVMYTSGSTGTPKGVMVEQRGVINRLVWAEKAVGLGRGRSVLQKTPFSFDVSVWEFFWPVITGGKVVMARPQGHKDPCYLIQSIRQHQITTVHFVPSMLQVFLEHPEASGCSTLERVVCSGEALSSGLVRRLQELLPHAELHNLYGPTEATVDVTAWRCPPDSQPRVIPIGKPIANTQVYILDGYQKPVPIGVRGEIYIGGVGVARGYLNRPELTAERFLNNPFRGESGGRMYRTGDLGRWLPDGGIEFLGRNDFQVKIRGFRIELEEIEARMREQAGVSEAVVVAREDTPGDKQLVAYYTSSDAIEPGSEGEGAERIRTHLSGALPEYMVPAAYVRLEKLPLTVNGKLDRKALPVPGREAYADRGYEPPQGETETALAAIWAELLKLDRVGRHDNFFESGGHSLLAVRVVTRLRQQLGMDVAIRDLFTYPILRDLVSNVKRAELVESLSIPRAKRRENSSWREPGVITAMRSDGHRIVSRDGGRTWYDLQSGKVVG